MSALLIVGVGPGVGATVATAALAACATEPVVVVEPVQTGNARDLDTVTRLARIREGHELIRHPDPLPPHHAALFGGRPGLEFAPTAQRVDDLALDALVLVDTPAGLTVPFDSDHGWTVIDLAHHLYAPVLLVVGAGAATLDHALLAVERVEEEQLNFGGIVVGRWPAQPAIDQQFALYDLRARTPRRELAGILPDGMGTLARREFRAAARAGLAPSFGGTLSWRSFRESLSV